MISMNGHSVTEFCVFGMSKGSTRVIYPPSYQAVEAPWKTQLTPKRRFVEYSAQGVPCALYMYMRVQCKNEAMRAVTAD